MIKTILISSIVMGIALFGMAIGVIVAGKRLKGSCGGLGAVMGDDCDFCEKKDKCENRLKRLAKGGASPIEAS